MRIDRDANPIRYFDMNGKEIHEGDVVVMGGYTARGVYLTENGELGTDATNPEWLATGKAFPCQYGIYPFNESDTPVLVRKTKREE